jgi:hypothetical protein
MKYYEGVFVIYLLNFWAFFREPGNLGHARQIATVVQATSEENQALLEVLGKEKLWAKYVNENLTVMKKIESKSLGKSQDEEQRNDNEVSFLFLPIPEMILSLISEFNHRVDI